MTKDTDAKIWNQFEYVALSKGRKIIRIKDREQISVVIPYGTTEIGYRAFWGCNKLKTISIPISVSKISEDAFLGCRFVISKNQNAFYVDNWIIGCDGAADSCIIECGTQGIGNSTFRYHSHLNKITIPNTVTSIGDCAFLDCIALKSIVIPDSVTYMGYALCCGCESLENVAISNNVTVIGEFMFNKCISLQSIIIPNNVTSIGDWALGECSNLLNITIPSNLTSIGKHALENCSCLTDITYLDTKEKWHNIKKEYDWNRNTGNYIIHCIDGDITEK